MPTMMAARAYAGQNTLQIERLPIPVPGQGEVLVQVAAAGMAPGMMKLLQMGRFKHLPTVPGHEIAGTVVRLGESVDSAWLHARVRVHPMLSCGRCAYCVSDRQQMCREAAIMGHAAFGKGDLPRYAQYHNGGLAEYVVAPADLLDRLPDHVSFDVGAKIHDLANAARALKCAALPERARLAITAATGTMGTATLKLAQFYGVSEVMLIARSRERLEGLRELAGGVAVHVVALEELGDGWENTGALTEHMRKIMPEGVDAVLDYFPDGVGTVQATAAMAVGATMVHMGGSSAPLPWAVRDIMINCWRIVGTRGCTRADTDDVLALLASGKLNAEALITHRFSLADVNSALEAMRSRSLPIWMAIVNPGLPAAHPSAY